MLYKAHAISEDSDQTVQMQSLHWSHKSYCRFCHALSHMCFFSRLYMLLLRCFFQQTVHAAPIPPPRALPKRIEEYESEEEEDEEEEKKEVKKEKKKKAKTSK